MCRRACTPGRLAITADNADGIWLGSEVPLRAGWNMASSHIQLRDNGSFYRSGAALPVAVS